MADSITVGGSGADGIVTVLNATGQPILDSRVRPRGVAGSLKQNELRVGAPGLTGVLRMLDANGVVNATLDGFNSGLSLGGHGHNGSISLLDRDTDNTVQINSGSDGVDVFLCPTNFTPAFPHDGRPFAERTVATPEGERPYDSQAFWVAHAALPGLPAVAAPVGRAPGGLPVGVQVIGPLYEDDTALTFAEPERNSRPLVGLLASLLAGGAATVIVLIACVVLVVNARTRAFGAGLGIAVGAGILCGGGVCVALLGTSGG